MRFAHDLSRKIERVIYGIVTASLFVWTAIGIISLIWGAFEFADAYSAMTKPTGDHDANAWSGLGAMVGGYMAINLHSAGAVFWLCVQATLGIFAILLKPSR